VPPPRPTAEGKRSGGVRIGSLEVRIVPPPAAAPPLVAVPVPPAAAAPPLSRGFRTFGLVQG
jgi:hypothetical protein